MIVRLLLSILVVSGRWAPPAVLLAVWTALLLSGPATALSHTAAIFLGVVIVTVWLSLAVAAMADSPTRDLLAARVGSAGRLHLESGVVAAGVALGLCVPMLAAITLSAVPSERTVRTELLFSAGLTLAAVIVGVGLGYLLARPIVAPPIAVFAVIPALIGLAKIPTVETVLLQFSRDEAGPLGWLLIATVVFVVLAGVAGAWMVNRRSAATPD